MPCNLTFLIEFCAGQRVDDSSEKVQYDIYAEENVNDVVGDLVLDGRILIFEEGDLERHREAGVDRERHDYQVPAHSVRMCEFDDVFLE